MKSLLKNSIKIAGVTCVAAGAVALVTSGTALKAIGEGGKYLMKAVKKLWVNRIPRNANTPQPKKTTDLLAAEELFLLRFSLYSENGNNTLTFGCYDVK